MICLGKAGHPSKIVQPIGLAVVSPGEGLKRRQAPIAPYRAETLAMGAKAAEIFAIRVGLTRF